jgi:hypothetical protein
MIGTKQPYAVLEDGSVILYADLPPAGFQRWTPRKKAIVVVAVRGGLISLEDVCKRYSLTAEEFSIWRQAFEAGGIRGLRVTKIRRH